MRQIRSAFWKTPAILSRFGTLLIITSCFANLACDGGGASPTPGNSKVEKVVPTNSYEVIRVFPHDTEAFTQGLVFHQGKLIESTGQVGQSSLRLVNPQTGNVLQKVDVPPPYFAEGITLLNGKIYQLTWQDQTGFVYDAASLQKIDQFPYEGEGWGLTTDGTSLIMSDGSNRLRFIDPASFIVTKTIRVFDQTLPVENLNELEYVQGEIYSNIWHDDRIARIDPETGKVVGWINLAGLLKPSEITDEEAVLNGIAYDEANKTFFVTGKLWPKAFEIRVK